MSNSIFIDTTLCTGCRACQVACKQWHDLPAEETTNRGTYENPADLSEKTYKVVRMREVEANNKLQWLFFPEQCRHCEEAPCLDTAADEKAIYRDKTGAIIYTEETKNLDFDEIKESCPYNIPRKASNGTIVKCDMCYDRVNAGKTPSCVQVCPSGAMNFGSKSQMLSLANKRLNDVKKDNPDASICDADDVSVIYLVANKPELHFENAVADAGTFDMTRKVALRKMFRPVTEFISRLA